MFASYSIAYSYLWHRLPLCSAAWPGIAAAVNKLTSEYFKDYFAWPVSLIITGITWMFVSWWVPRFKANLALKQKE